MNETTLNGTIAKREDTMDVARTTTLKLFAYCQSRDWSGIDPYDALNSKLFKAVPLMNRWLPRLALTQVLKRSPFNFRRFLSVPPTQNPKALGLFLMSVLKLSKIGLLEQKNLHEILIERLVALRSPNTPYWCWGYSFPWQTRTLVVPRGTPNLVCTTFAANALMDAYEEIGDPRYLEMAASAAEYIVNDLYWTGDGPVAGMAYPLPSMRQNIHNGNFLGAALLCRVARHTGENRFIDPALRVARYSASKQQEDGSWKYGEIPTQQWIDNFHTGYNLCGLQSIGRSLDTSEFESHIQRGFEFYRNHFFQADGACKYFHDRTYPIDIHCVAQSIITLLAFKHLYPGYVSLVSSVLQWAMDHLWDDEGFFYYRVLRLSTIRTSYMRWSQAWMLLALSGLVSELDNPVRQSHFENSTVSLKASRHAS